MKMKMTDIIMIGVIVGIAFFFIGAMISKVFPSSETSLLSYKIAACAKLFGVGVLISSMVVGGIILENIDKNLRLLLLILGLILLIVYTVGSPSLEWSVRSGTSTYGSRPTGYGVPGFEFILPMLATLVIIAWKQRKKR